MAYKCTLCDNPASSHGYCLTHIAALMSKYGHSIEYTVATIDEFDQKEFILMLDFYLSARVTLPFIKRN